MPEREWIDPQYAELVAVLKKAQQPDRDPGEGPVRGFIVPRKP